MKKGFTFIEVALVLAVAGVIFAMVFIALPALQRSSRDIIRRDDIADFITAIKKYQTNNRGALPGGGDAAGTVQVAGYEKDTTKSDTTWQGFYNKYLGDSFADPGGDTYKLKVMKCNKQTGEDCGYSAGDSNGKMDYTLLVVTQATCNNDRTIGSSNPRNLAVLYRLEGSGSTCSST